MANRINIVQVRTPRDGDDSLGLMRAWLQGLPAQLLWWQRVQPQHASMYGTLECLVSQQTIQFFLTAPPNTADLVIHQLTALFPSALVTPVAAEYDPVLAIWQHSNYVMGGDLRLRASSRYPLAVADSAIPPDSMAPLLSWMSHLNANASALLQIRWQPLTAGRTQQLQRRWQTTDQDGNSTLVLAHAAAAKQKLASRLFAASLRWAVATPEISTTLQLAQSFTQIWSHLDTIDNGLLAKVWPSTGRLAKIMLQRRFLWRQQLLNANELSTLWHLPDRQLAAQPNIDWGKRLPGEPPANLPVAAIGTDVLSLAQTDFHHQPTAFGLRPADRRRHLYVLGKTGSGKSTLLANLIIQDLRAGRGLAVLDPHGDLFDTVLNFIPTNRINDVVIFNPAVPETAAQLNLFAGATAEQQDLLASGMVGVFRKLYSFSWGPRLEYILRNCILTLLTQPATLHDINRLLVDEDYRQQVTNQLTDPILLSFWQNEFAAMPERLKQEAIAPILNKVGQFVSSPLIRNVLNVPQSTFNVNDIMNNGRIFLANLAQGKLGEDNAALLGALLVTTFQIAAMGRAHLPESQRRDFYLYIDEFQNFATSGFLKILSEARKYRLNLTLANQYMDQMDVEVQEALFGNVGTIMSFVLGVKDAGWLKREFGNLYTENDLVALGKYQTIVKMLVDNETVPAFPAQTFPLFANTNHNRQKVLDQSAMRFGRKR